MANKPEDGQKGALGKLNRSQKQEGRSEGSPQGRLEEKPEGERWKVSGPKVKTLGKPGSRFKRKPEGKSERIPQGRLEEKPEGGLENKRKGIPIGKAEH
jgi:hypothetical protein